MQNRIFNLLVVATMLWLTTSVQAQPVTQIAAGGWGHSLFLKSDGSLWAMGNNQWGQLGDGTTNNIVFPKRIVASNVRAIAAGSFHSLFIKSDGSLWGMGVNGGGQLGDGTDLDNPGIGFTSQPELIMASNVTAIAAGQRHSLFLKSDGSLWVMGENVLGQLGEDKTGTYPIMGTNRPEQIVASSVTAIAAGQCHSMFLKNDGSLWAMGLNEFGQLGDGTTNNVKQSLPYHISHPVQIVASNVTAIAGGMIHSLFLKSDGSLWAMGNDDWGQSGSYITNNSDVSFPEHYVILPRQIVASNVTAIAAGGWHTLFLKSDGSLWGMGMNDFGQLGDGTHNNFVNDEPELIVASNVTKIVAGVGQSLFVKSDGSLWAMGKNSYGELGDGTTNNVDQPEQIVAGTAFVKGGESNRAAVSSSTGKTGLFVENQDYNKISGHVLIGGKVRLTFVGIDGTNYALDRSFSLSAPDWVPQQTNPAGAGGLLIFTNTPVAGTNNYWRIRSVP